MSMKKNKQMDIFSRETFKMGTLTGFRHFRVELRGREEMLILLDVPSSSLGQLSLRPMGSASALPPASPCQRERPKAPWEVAAASSEPEPPPPATTVGCTFLLAGYAHYNCPLAWVRAGHALFGPAYEKANTVDAPIELRASAAWKSRGVHAFEFVAELILATVRPPPENPFELDLAALEAPNAPAVDMLLLAGSLASFLRDVHLSSAPYAPKVEDDLLHCLRLHYSRLPKLLATLPADDDAPPAVRRGGQSSQTSFGGGDSPRTPYVRPHGFAAAPAPQPQPPQPSQSSQLPQPPQPPQPLQPPQPRPPQPQPPITQSSGQPPQYAPPQYAPPQHALPHHAPPHHAPPHHAPPHAPPYAQPHGQPHARPPPPASRLAPPNYGR